jgi:xylan 1,4-beta-xylosidase
MPRFWQEGVGSCHIYMTLNSAQGINFKDHFKMARTELGMKRVRAHGILNDDVGIYKEVNGVPSYNWTRLDSIFDYLVPVGTVIASLEGRSGRQVLRYVLPF